MSKHEIAIDEQYQSSVPFLEDEWRVHRNATVAVLVDLGLESFEVLIFRHAVFFNT